MSLYYDQQKYFDKNGLAIKIECDGCREGLKSCIAIKMPLDYPEMKIKDFQFLLEEHGWAITQNGFLCPRCRIGRILQ